MNTSSDLAPDGLDPGISPEPAGRPIPHDPDALLFGAEAAHLLGLSHRTLESMRVRGGGPRFIRLSARAIRYRRADLVAWADERSRESTSDMGGPGHV